jgi:hypothetical protein
MSSLSNKAGGAGTRGRTKNKWENDKRHYCAVCNSWMGSDKQSILIHDSGKKHIENVEFQLEQRRKDKAGKEKQQTLLEASLRQMNQAADVTHAQDFVHYGGGATRQGPMANTIPSAYHPQAPSQYPVSTPPAMTHFPPAATLQSNLSSSQPAPSAFMASSQQQPTPSDIANLPHGVSINLNMKNRNIKKEQKVEEMASWQSRKQHRENSDTNEEAGEADVSSNATAVIAERKRSRAMLENEGYYELSEQTYLEGEVFDLLLEEDMPIQIWTGGDIQSTKQDLRRTDMSHLWKDGLIVKLYKRKQVELDEAKEDISCDVAYLRHAEDDDETMERHVDPQRIRLVVGQDDMLPSSVEEARAALQSILGSSTDAHIATQADDAAAIVKEEIDENTGFTKFITVSVKRTTKYQEEREQREHQREQRREEEVRKMEAKKDLEQRKMEEAKHASVDDSALGAYDVWGSKKGYKGVDIDSANNSTDKREVTDFSKSLANGKQNVAFKKRGASFSKAKQAKKRNVRRTTADDD